MTVLRNGFGIRSMQRLQDPLVAGHPLGKGYDRPYENPLLPQISTLTLAEQVDVSDEIIEAQVWTIVLTDPDGVAYTVLYTVTAADATAGTDVAGLAYMAGVLAAAIEADQPLANVVSAAATGAVITVSWIHPDQGVWTITAVCTPAAAEAVLLATPASSQVAGGTPLPMGHFVVAMAPERGGVRRARLPNSAADRVVGLSLRDTTVPRLFDTSLDGIDAYPSGSMAGVREEGDAAVLNVDTTAALVDALVYAVVDVTGGDALGAARATRDGTADVWTSTPTVANATVYGLQVQFPAWDGQAAQTFTFGDFTSDGSATAIEICDGILALMVADPAFAALVTLPAAGAATLILTGAILGQPMVVSDVAEAGDWTSIVHTTTAAQYTVEVQRTRWSRPTAAGAIGTVALAR